MLGALIQPAGKRPALVGGYFARPERNLPHQGCVAHRGVVGLAGGVRHARDSPSASQQARADTSMSLRTHATDTPRCSAMAL